MYRVDGTKGNQFVQVERHTAASAFTVAQRLRELGWRVKVGRQGATRIEDLLTTEGGAG